MADKNIEKSITYTIIDGGLAMALISTNKLRLAALQPNLVEYILVLIPADVELNKIDKLSDIGLFGGRILGIHAQTVIGGPPEPSSQ